MDEEKPTGVEHEEHVEQKGDHGPCLTRLDELSELENNSSELVKVCMDDESAHTDAIKDEEEKAEVNDDTEPLVEI